MSYRWMTRTNGKGAKVGMPIPILISRLLITILSNKLGLMKVTKMPLPNPIPLKKM
jgi:hypothetical protein